MKGQVEDVRAGIWAEIFPIKDRMPSTIFHWVYLTFYNSQSILQKKALLFLLCGSLFLSGHSVEALLWNSPDMQYDELKLRCALWELIDTCSYWVLEVWLISLGNWILELCLIFINLNLETDSHFNYWKTFKYMWNSLGMWICFFSSYECYDLNTAKYFHWKFSLGIESAKSIKIHWILKT